MQRDVSDIFKKKNEQIEFIKQVNFKA